MNFDLGTLCLIGVVLIVAVFVLPRLMNSMRGNNYSQRGPESPSYDDPNIRSRGGFGRGDDGRELRVPGANARARRLGDGRS